MIAEQRIHLVDIPIGGNEGRIWNRLHGEREDICEILLKQGGPAFEAHRDCLQARLRRVDDALDRLMAGSYGNCSRCGHTIGDAKLAIDPTFAFCAECDANPSAGVVLRNVNPGPEAWMVEKAILTGGF